MVLADLARVGPQPVVCWLWLQLAVSSAEEQQCSSRRSPLWWWSSLQPADWIEWPCFPAPSASLSAPIKIKTSVRFYVRFCTFFLATAGTFMWNVIPGSPCETGPRLSACRARLCPDSTSSTSPARLVCPSQMAPTGWEGNKWSSKSYQDNIWQDVHRLIRIRNHM